MAKAKAAAKTVKNGKLPKAKFQEYKKILIDERDRLSSDISHLKDDHLQKSQKEMTGELSGYSIHMADMSSDDYDRGVALGIFTQEQEILYLIEEALKRMDEGTFGICEVCDKPISAKRLEAVPYATLCLPCQSEQEKKKKA
ncbi:MAG: TraR/DksA C4-type zinc finger protein [Chlamydiae bacterium]|nr:TraR/DksA C4-type zinc finger protein [Chlamydiota bacterium]MBI3266121.1 TraR/DksA C4-type zinc finger protein [Chlamydiota bacterium]